MGNFLSKKSLIHNSSLLKIIVISISLLTTIGVTAKEAKALDFNFSFTDDSNDFSFEATYVSGTVSGVIRGLEDNQANQAPTSVEILSFPGGLLGDLETSLIASDWELVLGSGFTVNNGAITAADWVAQQSDDGSGDDVDQIRINFQSINSLTFDSLSTLTGNSDSFAGVTFSSASASVPFEFSPSLGLVAVGSIFGLSRLRKHRATRKTINEIYA